MDMIGGGHFHLGPGQVTDDSELQMCIIWALIESNQNTLEDEEKYLNTDIFAQWYAKWLSSKPFDIANTIYNSFVPLL